jgi:cyclopropane fatty-acyl-phospholipid synthase-like methyltransferase
MTSTPPKPTIQDVEAYYDSMGQFYKIVWGESLHGGYWPEGEGDLTLPEAQEAMTRLMIAKTPIQAGQGLLDVGCGTGLPGIRAAQATGCQVRGITVAHGQVAEANQRAVAEGVADRAQFQWANAMDLPFEDGSFDAAWAFESIFHMPDRQHVLGEISRVLKPGRTFVLTDIVEISPLSDEQRAVWYPSFQISSITTLDGYQEMFAQVGFEQVDFVDLSLDIEKTLELTKSGIVEKREALLAAYGPEMFTMLDQVWAVVESIYSKHIKYVLLVARKTA